MVPAAVKVVGAGWKYLVGLPPVQIGSEWSEGQNCEGSKVGTGEDQRQDPQQQNLSTTGIQQKKIFFFTPLPQTLNL